MLIGLMIWVAMGFWVPGQAAERLGNQLRPFSTDGCSNFPDGVPYFSTRLWLRCCVEHDVVYWHGGTKADRQQADERLYRCVKESARSAALANLIYLGVRFGGHPGLPTSTGWGKGWTRPRGYRAFSEEERAQVEALLPRLPDKIEEQALESRPAIRPGYSLTGNHCLDTAVVHTQLALGRGFEIEAKNESTQENPEGWHHTLTLLPKGCSVPARFEFQLLRPTACTDQMNELLLRGRIRLRRIEAPQGCEAREGL